MTARNQVRVGDATIEYTVRRSKRRRKTVQITVDARGVIVAAPARTPDRELRDIVSKRAAWILRHAEATAQRTAPTRFASGNTIPWLGRDVPIVLTSTDDAPEAHVTLQDDAFVVAVPRNLTEPARDEAIRDAFRKWYRSRAEERLPETVALWLPRVGWADQPRVLIRDQRRRWGSCGRDGTLRFSWRLMMLDSGLIDYVVVHELSHLKQRNHSPDFWADVVAVMPGAKRRRTLLRETERTLPL